MSKTPSTDELFQIITINTQRKVKSHIKLKTRDGDEVPIRETIEKLTEWVLDKQADNDSSCSKQIIPLMGQSVVGGLTKLLGTSASTYLLSREEVRTSLMYMMTVGFYLMKFLQKKDIIIDTYEEPITDEDIAMYKRITVANDLSVQGAALGVDGYNVLKLLVQKGKLKKEDLEAMGITDLDIEFPETPKGSN